MSITKIRKCVIASLAFVFCGASIASGALFSETFAIAETERDAWQTNNDQSSAVYKVHDAASSAGLNVRLAANDVLQFNEIIDLSKIKKNDTLVDFYVTPDIIGTEDFERLYFTFTDIENENCTLTLEAKASPDGHFTKNYPWTYVYAAGNGQKLRAYTSEAFTDDQYGLGVVHSFWGNYAGTENDVTNRLKDFGVDNTTNLNTYGLNDNNKLDCVHTSFNFDYEDNRVYVNGGRSVFDLDDPELSSTVWDGFESGKVRLSVKADNYSSMSANFVIKSVYGLDLTKATFEDKAGPEINVELPSQNSLETYIGYGFTLPSATAKDDYDGDCALDISVWRRYASEHPMAVPTSDGKFTATVEGYYTIVYKSEDKSGNISSKEVNVYAKPAVDLAIKLDGEYVQSAKIGDYIDIAKYSVTGAVSNIYDVKINAKIANQSVAISEGGFILEKVGEYTIEYTVTDYLGRSAIVTYNITSASTDKPLFKNGYEFPQALVSGIKYTLTPYYAHDYTSGSLVMKKIPLYITDANGTREADNATFIPTVANNGDNIKLAFKDGENVLEKDVPVIVPQIDGVLHMERYFLSDGITATPLKNGINIVADSENGSWLFANALISDNFAFTIRANTPQSKFTALKVNIKDSEDGKTSLTFDLLYDEGKTYLVADGKATLLNYGFGNYRDENKNNIQVQLQGNKLTVGDTVIRLASMDNDKSFVGFSSGKVYLSVSFVNAQAGANYDVTMVNGQSVSNSSNDRIRPKINILGKYEVCALPGDTVVIPHAIAADVLNSVDYFHLTVKDSKGNIATSTDGILLDKVAPDRDYNILVESSGQYVVSYVTADTANGNDYTRTFAINVEDKVAPELKLGKITDKVKLGETIVVPVLDYSDNVSAKEELTLFVTVYTPDGTIIKLVNNSNSFIAAQKGNYEIRISIYDKAGNTNYTVYTVTVE